MLYPVSLRIEGYMVRLIQFTWDETGRRWMQWRWLDSTTCSYSRRRPTRAGVVIENRLHYRSALLRITVMPWGESRAARRKERVCTQVSMAVLCAEHNAPKLATASLLLRASRNSLDGCGHTCAWSGWLRCKLTHMLVISGGRQRHLYWGGTSAF